MSLTTLDHIDGRALRLHLPASGEARIGWDDPAGQALSPLGSGIGLHPHPEELLGHVLEAVGVLAAFPTDTVPSADPTGDGQRIRDALDAAMAWMQGYLDSRDAAAATWGLFDAVDDYVGWLDAYSDNLAHVSARSELLSFLSNEGPDDWQAEAHYWLGQAVGNPPNGELAVSATYVGAPRSPSALYCVDGECGDDILGDHDWLLACIWMAVHADGGTIVCDGATFPLDGDGTIEILG